MSNYSITNLPSNKALGHLLNIHLLGGWPRPSVLPKSDREMLIRNSLVNHDGTLTSHGWQILDHVNTPFLPTPLVPYANRRNQYGGGATMHVGWSSDSTIWFYREGWNIFNPILHCLAVDFSLLMFGCPSDRM